MEITKSPFRKKVSELDKEELAEFKSYVNTVFNISVVSIEVIYDILTLLNEIVPLNLREKYKSVLSQVANLNCELISEIKEQDNHKIEELEANADLFKALINIELACIKRSDLMVKSLHNNLENFKKQNGLKTIFYLEPKKKSKM